MRLYRTTLVLSLLFLLACSDAKKDLLAIDNSPSMQTKLNEVIDPTTANKDFMGNIAVTQNGKLIYSRAIGFDDIKSKKKSTIHSKYRIGSISKTYTAVLLFKAIEEGRLTLEQTLAQYFPEHNHFSQIRIADLLQHRSGIPNFTKDNEFFSYHTQFKSKQDMLKMIANYGSHFEPNSQAQYSNSNYFLLAYILEKVYGMPYETLLKEKITTPLGLTDTYQGGAVSLADNENYSYRYESGWQLLPETHMSITLGSASLVSTASDLALFLDAVFAGRIISMSNVDKMMSINEHFGMGIERYELTNRVGFGHRGTLDGYKSTAIYFPEDKVSLVINSNGSNDNINDLYLEILKTYFDDPLVDISANQLEKFLGVYTSIKDQEDSATFIREKNTLVHVIKNEFKEPLTYQGQRSFLFEQMYGPSILFTFSEDGTELLFEQGEYKGTYVKNHTD